MRGTSNGSVVEVKDPKRSGGTPEEAPDSEVLTKARRRQFSAEYKLKVLEEADACRKPGEIAALLRREGLYSSHLTDWRKARREGALGALKKGRGPTGPRRDPVTRENEQLRKENARLRRRLQQAQAILDIHKNCRARVGASCGGRNSHTPAIMRLHPWEERPFAYWWCYPRRKTWSRDPCGLDIGDASRRSRLGK